MSRAHNAESIKGHDLIGRKVFKDLAACENHDSHFIMIST